MQTAVTIIGHQHSRHQNSLWKAVACGLNSHGIDVEFSTEPKASHKIVACWGWRRGEIMRSLGHEVLVFEHAYLGDRKSTWTSIGWNGLNGHADFKINGHVDLERFARMKEADKTIKLKPWQDDGEYIIIMGQLAGDMSLAHVNLTTYYETWARKAELYYKKPVFFRPHPHNPERNFTPNIPIKYSTLEDALLKAHMVIAHNSNSLVDSVLAGVSSVAMNKGTMAWDVCGHSIEERIKTDRMAWLAKLAHCQWDMHEIQLGAYIPRLFKGIL